MFHPPVHSFESRQLSQHLETSPVPNTFVRHWIVSCVALWASFCHVRNCGSTVSVHRSCVYVWNRSSDVLSVCLSAAGLTRREIVENCVDRFTEIMQDGRRHGPESNRTRHLCLGTVTKPLGYLSSGMKVMKAGINKPGALLFVDATKILRAIYAGEIQECGPRRVWFTSSPFFVGNMS